MVRMVETAMTASGQASDRIGSGAIRWRRASCPTRAAEANTSPACNRLAKASPLPWP